MVDVIRVLPDVAGQQGHVGSAQRGGCIGGVDDIDRAVGFLDQPCPARAKIAQCALRKRLLKRGQRAPLGIDRGGQSTGRMTRRGRRQTVPEKRVIPDLGCVVKDRSPSLSRFRMIIFMVNLKKLTLIFL